MKIKSIVLILIFFFWSNISYSQTYAIKIDKFSISPDIRVEFTQSSVGVHETWRIVGSCKNAINPTKVEIVEFSIGRNTRRVQLTNSAIADKNICIVNPEDLPRSILEMLR